MEHQCFKNQYQSKKDAQTALNYIMRTRRRNRPEKLRIYHCHCGFWHLTKTE